MLALLVPGVGMGGGGVTIDVPAFVTGAAAIRVGVTATAAGLTTVAGSTSTDGST